MSAAAAWDSLPVQIPVSRPRLVVLDGGAVGARRSSVLDLPRWFRLALTLAVAALLVSGLFWVTGAGAAPAPAPLSSVEVRPGQTLSEIAVAELPGLPTAEAVARIQLVNNLPSSHVTAGQVIVIPAS